MAFKRLDDSALARQQYKRYEYARDLGHLAFLAKSTKCADFFNAKQWDPAIEAELRTQRKPILTINKVFSTLEIGRAHV